ncbi:hypothetical protein JCM11251_005683 [Rhodosporidiobolus azoricus]
MLGVLLLPVYVGVDTARALIAYALLNAGASLSPTLITFAAELCKLSVSVIAAVALKQSFALPPPSSDHPSTFGSSFKPYLRFAVPAALYFVNNVLFLGGLQVTTPALLQVCVLSKLPLTALLHHFVIRPRRNPAMWTSLIVLTFGLVLAGAPVALWDALWEPRLRRSIQVNDLMTGPAIGLTIGVLSACASVWTELMLKDEVPFWTAQVHLYGWGTAFAGVFAFARGLPSLESSAIAAYLFLVPVTACSGLLVALILRQRDNLVKLVGASLCITTVYLLQHLFFPSVSTIEARAILGIGILTVATWTFNYYKDQGATGPIYFELSTSENGEFTPSSSVNGEHEHKVYLDANSQRTLAPSPFASTKKDPYRPTFFRLTVAALIIIFLATLASFTPVSDHAVKRDVARFFAAKGIKPATWGDKVTDPECLFNKMGSVYAHDNSDWIGDFEDRQGELGCPLYPIPDSGLITHVFWSGPWRNPSHWLVTDAWLATQRLSDGHKLIWWYKGTGPDDAFLERYTAPASPYFGYVEARRFNEEEEAAGSCLMSMREWVDPEYAASLEMPIQTKSDLVRLLLLSKYGGNWLDADTIPLRDLTPLIRMGPSVPMMDGGSNNHVLLYGPAWAGYGAGMLEMACTMPYEEKLFKEKFPTYNHGGHWYWQYNYDVHKLCTLQGCGIYGSPLEWLDVEIDGWSHDSIQACARNETTGLGDYGGKHPLPAQFHGPFTWHARMAKKGDDDSCWEPDSGTALSALAKRVKQVLEHLPLEDGHDLFPGPGFVGGSEDAQKPARRLARRWG